MKERTSTINEDPSSHEEHPNQAGLPKTDSNSAMANNSGGGGTMANGTGANKPNRAVLTKNSSFAMRTLTTRLSGFFRKFSTSTSGNGPSSGLSTDASDNGLDVCAMCHRLVKRGLNDKTGSAGGGGALGTSGGGENGSGSGGGGKKKRRRGDAAKDGSAITADDEDDDGDVETNEDEEVDFTSNILVGDLGNLTSILKKPSAFHRHSSYEDDDSHLNTNQFL